MDGFVREVASLARRRVLLATAAAGMLALSGAAGAATYGEAMGWYVKAAEAGDPEAQYLLGYALETGARGTADEAAARHWYGAAAAEGHARGALRLAVMCLEGRGGPVDTTAARALLEAAAEAGETDAMSLLGWLLASSGDDDVLAYRWLSLAAEAGDGAAAANLAMLVNGMSPERMLSAEADLAAWRTHR